MNSPLAASTVCFHYAEDGERCSALCLDPAFFCCATHLHQYLHTATDELLASAAASILDCTEFTENALPYLACNNVSSWKRLCNALDALSFQGYHEQSELLTMLVSSIESIADHSNGKSGEFRKGKPFERLITRLYLEELAPSLRRPSPEGNGESVRVLWNKKLPSLAGGRRQVDVLLQWHRDGITSETIVECRDSEVEVTEVNAFATLVRHLQAQRGVMVSSVGFQSGALGSAKLDGIETRVVTEDDFGPEFIERIVDPAYEFEVTASGFDFATPGEVLGPTQIPFDQIKVMRPGLATITLGELVAEAVDNQAPVQGSMPPHVNVATPGARLLFPDGRTSEVRAIRVTLRIVKTQRKCRLMVPRRPLSFLVKSSQDGVRKVDASAVPLFLPPVFEADCFYINLMGQSYYCEAVDSGADEARLILLKNRQHNGSHIDVEMRTGLDQAGHHYPIRDLSSLELLRKDLVRFNRIRSR